MESNKNQSQKENSAAGNSQFNELIYNLIIFDEFLQELSAILIEQSVVEQIE